MEGSSALALEASKSCEHSLLDLGNALIHRAAVSRIMFLGSDLAKLFARAPLSAILLRNRKF